MAHPCFQCAAISCSDLVGCFCTQADGKLQKLEALFRVCADLFLDLREVGYHGLDWNDLAARVFWEHFTRP